MPASLKLALRQGVAALGLASLLFGAGAQAAPAVVSSQVPGFYRYALGDFTVTALYDGFVDLSPSLLKGMSAEAVQRRLSQHFIAHREGVQTAVNAYLVHTGAHLVLVDSGAAKCFGPKLGNILDNLRAAGYTAEDVDAVLLTHLHPDHACGLVSAEGKPVFAKATVWVAKEEAAFWLSEKLAQHAPEAQQALFKMARESLEPYRESGQFKTFARGDTLLPGLAVLPSHGHTPGHSAYLFSSKERKLLVWGDIVHSHAVQFAHPEVAIEFDTDTAGAIATRKELLAKAGQAGWTIAGAHLPFPGLGHVGKAAKGYTWVPVEYGPQR